MPPRRRRGTAASGDDDRPDGDGAPELGRNPDADPVQIHRDYVERHIGGGGPPTSDAYARAIEQFSRLPGATRTPSTGMTAESIERRARGEDVVAPEDPSAGPQADRAAPEDGGDADRAAADDDTGGVWEPGR